MNASHRSSSVRGIAVSGAIATFALPLGFYRMSLMSGLAANLCRVRLRGPAMQATAALGVAVNDVESTFYVYAAREPVYVTIDSECDKDGLSAVLDNGGANDTLICERLGD